MFTARALGALAGKSQKHDNILRTYIHTLDKKMTTGGEIQRTGRVKFFINQKKIMSNYKLFKKIKKIKKARFYLNSWCICIYICKHNVAAQEKTVIHHTSYISISVIRRLNYNMYVRSM